MRETAADSSGDGPLVGQQVAELGVAGVTHRRLQGYRRQGDAPHIGDLALGPIQRARQLGARRHRPERHRKPSLDRLQLAHPIAHVDGEPDRAALLRHRAPDRLADPQRRVGREAQAAPVVELLHRTHQADRALLDQVEQGHAGVLALEALGQVDDEAQVGLDHAVLGGHVAALDPPGELELFGVRQQAGSGDALEEQAEAIAQLTAFVGWRGGSHVAQHPTAASRDLEV